MNTSTRASTTVSTTTAMYNYFVMNEAAICDKMAADVYSNFLQYSSVAAGLPLHLIIIVLLLVRVFKRRFYHFLIIAESITEVLALIGVFVVQTACVMFKKLMTDYLLNTIPLVQLILTVFLMLYWMTAIRSQGLFDIFLYAAAAVATLTLVGGTLFQQLNREQSVFAFPVILANVAGNVILSVECFFAFFLVMRMDVSYFSEVSLKGQRKMTIALLLQFICVLIRNVFDVLDSYMSYESITNPIVLKGNKVNLSDPVALAAYRAELMEYLGSITAFMSSLQAIATVYSRYLPFIRGVLIAWAIRPLLQKRKVVFISRSVSDNNKTV